MKQLIQSILFLFCVWTAQAQAPTSTTNEKAIIGVMNIATKGIPYDAEQMGNITRIELDKLELFNVLDRYDIEDIAAQDSFDIKTCFGKTCVISAGKLLKADKMLTGSAERYLDKIVVTLREIDVATGKVEKSKVKEFLDLPKEIKHIVAISIREMYGLENDDNLILKLTKEHNYESLINTPHRERLNLSGPRFGVVFLTGEAASIYRMERHEGGFDSKPIMSQFGYQFEAKYLNEGNWQALFEFIPVISGVDQGLVIPSMTIMHGFRHNRLGIELAFGPTISMVQKGEGFHDAEGVWHLKSVWQELNPDEPLPFPEEKRLDSRGKFAVSTGFIIGAGMTIKSGKLNIPMNVFVVPNKEGLRWGVSVGFNAKRY